MKGGSLRLVILSGTLCWLVGAAPSHARFLQVDPVGYQDQKNLYAYVGNDPMNHSDPTGMCYEMSCPVNYFNEEASRLTRQAEAQVSNDIGRSLYEGSGLGALEQSIRDPSITGVAAAMFGLTPTGRMTRFVQSASSAFRAAAAGGRHAGMLARYATMSNREVRSSLRSYERTIAEHRDKIAHPERYMTRESATDPAAVARARHDWQGTINTKTEQRDIARDELRRRSLGGD